MAAAEGRDHRGVDRELSSPIERALDFTPGTLPLFSHFFVALQRPSATPPARREILCHFSAEPPRDGAPLALPPQVLDFCFPVTGTGPSPFVFVIGGGTLDTPVLFGMALLRTPVSAGVAGQQQQQRCYCMLSRSPLLPLLNDVLQHVCERFPFEASALPEDVEAVLRFVKESLRLPAPGDVIQYSLPFDQSPAIPNSPTRTFRCPVASSPRESSLFVILEWSIPALFHFLSLDNVVKLFGSLLCEKSVVFVCPDASLLTSVALSAIAITRPLSWQGLFVPLLPESLRDILDAPVPFVLGVPALSSVEDLRENVVVVDVVANTVTASPGTTFPALPDGKVLRERLKLLHQQLHPSKASGAVSRPAVSGTGSSLTMVHSIALRFHEYTQWILSQVSKFHSHLPTEKQSSLESLRKGFVCAAQPANRPFVNDLLSSQHFGSWFAKNLATPTTRQREEQPPQPPPPRVQ